MGKEQGCGNRLQEAWEELLHKENGGGRKAKTEGLFEKLQKDLKPGNCLVMAKTTFSLFLRQPEHHRGSTGGMSNTHCQFPRGSKGSRSCRHSRAGGPLQLAFISPKDRA